MGAGVIGFGVLIGGIWVANNALFNGSYLAAVGRRPLPVWAC
jgi:hypothetical protein